MSTVTQIFTGVEGRVGQSIETNSDPSIANCIQFLNEYLATILAVCAEENSELGRSTGEITTEEDKESYDDLSDMYAPAQYGWILKTNSREKIKLKTEEELLNQNPSATNEPDSFYVDGSNNVIFMDTPDDEYTVEIPYWPVLTALTAVGNTVPFNGIFDSIIIEMLAMRIQNRDEYELSFELNWYGYLSEQVRRVIRMRKGRNVSIGL